MKKVTTIILIIMLFIFAMQVAGYGQDKPFPSDDEISLVVSQAKVAMEQYKLAVEQEERVMGKTVADANAKDRKTLEDWDFASKALNSKPQIFNSVVGFDFVLMLDEAAKNEILCSFSAVSAASVATLVKDTSKAAELISLSNSCLSASTLLLTVREGVAALYQKYVIAEEQLANRGLETARKCMDALKKTTVPKK